MGIPVVMMITATLALVGANSSFAAEGEQGDRSCTSGQHVVNRGDSTAGSQYHYQSTGSGLVRSFTHPYKAYRHVDYSNWRFSSPHWYIHVAYDWSLYNETTYALHQVFLIECLRKHGYPPVQKLP
jgi:hypothetical protein